MWDAHHIKVKKKEKEKENKRKRKEIGWQHWSGLSLYYSLQCLFCDLLSSYGRLADLAQKIPRHYATTIIYLSRPIIEHEINFMG